MQVSRLGWELRSELTFIEEVEIYLIGQHLTQLESLNTHFSPVVRQPAFLAEDTSQIISP